MNRLLATFLLLSSAFIYHAQEFRGRIDYDMDEEDITTQNNWEHFNFSGIEQFLMLFGVIIFLIGFAAYKGREEKKEGCLYPGMMFLGFICVWPIISGILGLLGKAVYYLVILALIIGGLYLVFGFIKSLFSKD